MEPDNPLAIHPLNGIIPMRVLFIAVLTLSLPMISLGKGKIEKKSYFYDKAQKDIEYAFYIPSAYDGKRQAPLVVILHGLGSNPHQDIRYSGVVKEAESSRRSTRARKP